MIATVLAQPASQLSGVAAAWNTQGDASDTHLAEPNVVISANGNAPSPTRFVFPRTPVDGFRAIVTSLQRTGIPRLPLGPSAVARMGQGFTAAPLVKPKPIAKVVQYAPVPAVEQAPNWWESVDNYR